MVFGAFRVSPGHLPVAQSPLAPVRSGRSSRQRSCNQAPLVSDDLEVSDVARLDIFYFIVSNGYPCDTTAVGSPRHLRRLVGHRLWWKMWSQELVWSLHTCSSGEAAAAARLQPAPCSRLSGLRSKIIRGCRNLHRSCSQFELSTAAGQGGISERNLLRQIPHHPC